MDLMNIFILTKKKVVPAACGIRRRVWDPQHRIPRAKSSGFHTQVWYKNALQVRKYRYSFNTDLLQFRAVCHKVDSTENGDCTHLFDGIGTSGGIMFEAINDDIWLLNKDAVTQF